MVIKENCPNPPFSGYQKVRRKTNVYSGLINPSILPDFQISNVKTILGRIGI